MEVRTKHREILRSIWQDGPRSRLEMHRDLSIRPNTVSDIVAELIEAGIVFEGTQESGAMGRPRTPIQIDSSRRHIVGLAIRPGTIDATRLSLTGEPVGDVSAIDVTDASRVIAVASELLASKVDEQTLAVGVTMTGAFDSDKRVSVISSALPGLRNVSLDRLYRAAGHATVVVENDMAALAARWLMQSEVEPNIDVLMICFGDGIMGGSVLVNGGPQRGYIVIDNEMGHQRLLVDSPVCYCGKPGCLTILCSSRYLRSLDRGSAGLLPRVASYAGKDAVIDRLLDILATGFTNAASTLFPDRLVLVSEMLSNPTFTQALLDRIRGDFSLAHIRGISCPGAPAMVTEVWTEPAGRPSLTAAWVALAWLFLGGWSVQSPAVRPRASGRKLSEKR